MSDDCILLIGHGSREGAANVEFESLATAYRAARPHLRVETAYIELARPLVADALASLAKDAKRIVVVPVFLFAAGHVKTDLPIAIAGARQAFPHVHIAAAPALGVHPAMIELAAARAATMIGDDAATRAKTMLLVVGRGSSDPDANGDFCKLTRMIGEGRGLMHVDSTFVGITQPLVETSLEWVVRMRPERLVVLPYFLFAGVLIARIERKIAEFAAHPSIATQLAPHLGIDELLLSLLDERTQGALRGDATLPCDTCHYRVGLTGHGELHAIANHGSGPAKARDVLLEVAPAG
jgi:sirohydrochlorin ferrochelatase